MTVLNAFTSTDSRWRALSICFPNAHCFVITACSGNVLENRAEDDVVDLVSMAFECFHGPLCIVVFVEQVQNGVFAGNKELVFVLRVPCAAKHLVSCDILACNLQLLEGRSILRFNDEGLARARSQQQEARINWIPVDTEAL